MRMKRRPLKFLQQHRLVIHHTHQEEADTVTSPHYSLLPDAPSQQHQQTIDKGPDLKTEADISMSKGVSLEKMKILQSIQQNATAINVPPHPGPLPSNIRQVTSGPGPMSGYMQQPVIGRGMPTSAPAMMNPQIRNVMEFLSPEQRNHISQLPQEKKGQYIQTMIQHRRMAQMRQQHQQRMHMQSMMQRGGPGGFARPHHPMGGGPMQANPPVQMNMLQQQQRQFMYPQRVPPPSHGQYNMMGASHMGQAGMFRQPVPGAPPPGHMYGMQRPHMFPH